MAQFGAMAQNALDEYENFKQFATKDFADFRTQCNLKYIRFLENSWKSFMRNEPLLLPDENTPVPPIPYDNTIETVNIEIEPVVVKPSVEISQPKPIAPVHEISPDDSETFNISFYGISPKIRLPRDAQLSLNDCSPKAIASAWEKLCGASTNNAIRDCLETRIRYNLCDWAYLLFLDQLGKQYCQSQNGATLLTAFFFCQSGYQMRLGINGNRLVLLYGSRHQIFNKPFFVVNATSFYPLGCDAANLYICDAEFEGETPLSMLIDKELLFGTDQSSPRDIKSKHFADTYATTTVATNLIKFFDNYPASAIDGNPLTKWAMYANTPLSSSAKESLYPALKNAIKGCDEAMAANKLLNWIQTGFEYEYDDKVWGHDRAFFAEETLYYPFCDCEDRSILFSRLVRDLLGLEAALIYYPGHLATAVKFNNDINGDAVIIDGEKFIVCDPTYIGAPIGQQMPSLKNSRIEAIRLTNNK